MTVIEAQADAAARNRNGNGRRPSGRARIEAAAKAAKAAEAAMGELYANPLIARLDLEGLGAELSDADLEAILHMVRRLEMSAPLPQRRPAGGAHADQMIP